MCPYLQFSSRTGNSLDPSRFQKSQRACLLHSLHPHHLVDLLSLSLNNTTSLSLSLSLSRGWQPPKSSNRERDELLKIQQEKETSYSKSSKRERDDLIKIQQERKRRVTQNPAREKETTYSKSSKRERDELLKIQQEKETSYSKSSKRKRRVIQNPARERESEGLIQNPAREQQQPPQWRWRSQPITKQTSWQ